MVRFSVFRLALTIPCNKHSSCNVSSGYEHHVLAVAWSPDAKCLVSGDRNGKVRGWDPSKGELQGKALAGHKKWICGIAWEPAHLSYPSRRFVTCGKNGDARI
ncbi:unnamed protein product, partial [Brassica oleracea var. botrytis]